MEEMLNRQDLHSFEYVYHRSRLVLEPLELKVISFTSGFCILHTRSRRPW